MAKENKIEWIKRPTEMPVPKQGRESSLLDGSCSRKVRWKEEQHIKRFTLILPVMGILKSAPMSRVVFHDALACFFFSKNMSCGMASSKLHSIPSTCQWRNGWFCVKTDKLLKVILMFTVGPCQQYMARLNVVVAYSLGSKAMKFFFLCLTITDSYWCLWQKSTNMN